MDNREFAVNGSLASRMLTCLTLNTVQEFLVKLIDGQISGYALASFLQNDSDYVSSLMYFPLDLTLFLKTSYTEQRINIGKIQATVQDDVKRVGQWHNSLKLFELNITRYFNNFLDFAPYTKLKVSVPYFGFVDIPMEYAYKGKIEGHVAVDFSSGMGTLYLYQGTILLTTKTAQLGIGVPLGKSNADEQNRNKVLHGIQGAMGGATLALGIASGNPLVTTAGVGLAGKTLTNALNDNVDRLTSYNGGEGDISMLAVDKTIKGIYEMPQNIVLPNAHLVGKPCRQTLSLGNLTGFTKVGDIHFDPNGEPIFQDEMDEIVNLLHAGVIL